MEILKKVSGYISNGVNSVSSIGVNMGAAIGVNLVSSSSIVDVHPFHQENKLSGIVNTLTVKLTGDSLKQFTNSIIGIQKRCKGDGAGLTSGIMIDMFINDFFKVVLKDSYKEYHVGECDLMINDIPISLKKVKGKSAIALDWSKNGSDSERERFTHPIMILNTKTMKWKDMEIKSGIYIVDHMYCKSNVTLSKNNKTDSLISTVYLQKMLENSIENNLFYHFTFPEEEEVQPFMFYSE